MKRVLIFSTAYFPFIGGAEVAVRELTDRMNGDFQFDLITAKLDKISDFEKIGSANVYRVGFGSKLDKFLLPFFGLFKAIALNKKNNYDIIWSIMASQASIAAAFFKIFYEEKKLVLNIQEGDTEEHLRRYVFGNEFLYKLLIRPLHTLVFKKADYIHAISNDLKNRASKNGVSCPVEVIPNGVDVSKFSIFNFQFSNEEKEKVKIITTSRLVKKNGIIDLVRAMQFLPENFELIIIGDGEEENNIKAEIKNLKIGQKIIMLGRIDNQIIPKYLADADIFVRPSLSEGLGISFLEAMSAGLPVIATPVGGIPDFLKDGETGLFCRVGDPKDIAEKIEKIASNKDLADKLRQNGKRLIQENYDWDKIALRLKNSFEKL